MHHYPTDFTLSARALDCAVAIALGHSLAIGQHGGIAIARTAGRRARPLPQYAIFPEQAAPIIWGAHICLNSLASVGAPGWEATLFAATPGQDVTVKADCPMRAGLLCFVRAKLGAGFTLPDAVHKVLELQK